MSTFIPTKTPSRLRSVDVLRVLGIVAVIGLHVSQQVDAAGLGHRFDLATLFDQLERFAVPMFFTLSGYFWAARCVDGQGAWRQACRLAGRVLFLFAAWSVIYVVVAVAYARAPAGGVAQAVRVVALKNSGPLTLLLQGTKVHLWFLPALACAALIAGACLAWASGGVLAGVALALFAIGLAGKAYAVTPLGFHAAFNFRNGPFFSLLPFGAGILLQRRGRQDRWLVPGLLLAVGGLALQLAEVRWLHARWGASLVQDYVAGTPLYGLGMAMVGLAGARWLQRPLLAAAGPLVLGIYAAQYLFIDALYPLDRALAGWPGWRIVYVALVFALSFALSRALAVAPPTRRLVM